MRQTSFDAIVFDVGGVLVAHDNVRIYAALAARCRDGVSARDVKERVVDPRIDTGERPVSDLHAELAHDLGYDGDRTRFLDDWCCHFTPDLSMIAFAGTLSRTTRVLLFSNTNREHWDFLVADARTGLGTFERYLSYELGVAKPAVAAYERVAREAGIAPGASLFLDDKRENVEGAREAGFAAEIFAGEAWLRGFLSGASMA